MRRISLKQLEEDIDRRKALLGLSGDGYVLPRDALPHSRRSSSLSASQLRRLASSACHASSQKWLHRECPACGVSQNHLMKMAHDLGKVGYVEGVRGRTGGIRLARPAAQISVGEVVRRTGEGVDQVECDECAIAPACDLTRILDEALAAFMKVLDSYTLADLLKRRTKLLRLLGVGW